MHCNKLGLIHQLTKFTRSMASGKIQTVLGPISPSQLGRTLPHEHIRINFQDSCVEPTTERGKEKARDGRITLDNLGWIRQNPYSHAMNLNLSDENMETMVEEVNAFKEFGGDSIVEVTTTGMHPDWEFLKELSETTGINLIVGTGYYIHSDAIVDYITSSSIQDITKGLVKDIEEGRNGIKAGVIGEVGCSYPLKDVHKKSLIAAIKAHIQTGIALLIHPGRDARAPMEIMEIIKEYGGDCNKTTMSHLDRTIFDNDRLLELARTGCYLQYDLFGYQVSHYQYDLSIDFPSDAQRIQFIKFLISKGYEDKILISQDIFTKHALVKYGGHGYAHILENVVPKMLQRGITQQQIDKFLIENPKRLMTF